MSGKKIMPFLLPSNSIFDIDDKFSFKMVEEIFTLIHKYSILTQTKMMRK